MVGALHRVARLNRRDRRAGFRGRRNRPRDQIGARERPRRVVNHDDVARLRQPRETRSPPSPDAAPRRRRSAAACRFPGAYRRRRRGDRRGDRRPAPAAGRRRPRRSPGARRTHPRCARGSAARRPRAAAWAESPPKRCPRPPAAMMAVTCMGESLIIPFASPFASGTRCSRPAMPADADRRAARLNPSAGTRHRFAKRAHHRCHDAARHPDRASGSCAATRPFAVASVGILALGISLSADAVRDRQAARCIEPWPYHGYDRIVTVRGQLSDAGPDRRSRCGRCPRSKICDARRTCSRTSSPATPRNVNLTYAGPPERVRAAVDHAQRLRDARRAGVARPHADRRGRTAGAPPGRRRQLSVLADATWRRPRRDRPDAPHRRRAVTSSPA